MLTPNDFADLTTVGQCLLTFERRCGQTAKPFEWKFTRADLAVLMKRLAEKGNQPKRRRAARNT